MHATFYDYQMNIIFDNTKKHFFHLLQDKNDIYGISLY